MLICCTICFLFLCSKNAVFECFVYVFFFISIKKWNINNKTLMFTAVKKIQILKDFHWSVFWFSRWWKKYWLVWIDFLDYHFAYFWIVWKTKSQVHVHVVILHLNYYGSWCFFNKIFTPRNGKPKRLLDAVDILLQPC